MNILEEIHFQITAIRFSGKVVNLIVLGNDKYKDLLRDGAFVMVGRDPYVSGVRVLASNTLGEITVF